jgi:hypothetical protein
MSKISLSGNASGTGTFTLASPNSNTDRTLTLPDATGTMLVSGQPVTATTGNFSGDVTLGSSVLATPTGSAPSYTCRAWVNFNGQGTVAIRASGNVSSITDNNAGDYTINFTTAMPDADYAVSIGAVKNDTNPDGNFRATFGQSNILPSTTSFRIVTAYASGGNTDFPVVACIVFR